MYLRNNLIYINIIYILYSIQSTLEEFLKESGDFIDDYKERLTQSKGTRRWNILTKRLFDKMFRIDSIINKGLKMNFLEAHKLAQTGEKMRRKEWLPGGSSAWHGKEVYVWWDPKYKCLLAAGPYVPIGGQKKFKDTKGYTYVCEGNDVEANDWEKAATC